MRDLFNKLKQHLLDNKYKYYEHNSWCGDTEGGFYSTDEFDFDKMCEEIDRFGEELNAKEGK